MKHANIEGNRIHYEIHGSGAPRALSYCLDGNLTFQRPQAEILAQDYQVLL